MGARDDDFAVDFGDLVLREVLDLEGPVLGVLVVQEMLATLQSLKILISTYIHTLEDLLKEVTFVFSNIVLEVNVVQLYCRRTIQLLANFRVVDSLGKYIIIVDSNSVLLDDYCLRKVHASKIDEAFPSDLPVLVPD